MFEDGTGANDKSGGWDIDSVGHTAVGLLWNRLPRRKPSCGPTPRAAGNFVTLDLLGAGDPNDSATSVASNRATVVSDDGTDGGRLRVSRGQRWRLRLLHRSLARPSGPRPAPAPWYPPNGVFTDDSPGEVLAICRRGAVVTGVWNRMPFIWSSTLRHHQPRLRHYEGYLGYGQATALDGRLVLRHLAEGEFGAPFPFVSTRPTA